MRPREHRAIWGLVGAALVVALVAAYASVVRLLVDQWWSNSMYSHGFLIPLLSGYFLWMNRTRISATSGTASYRTGLPMLAVGLLLLAIGKAGSVAAAQQISLLPTLAGLVLLTGGSDLLRAVWFPLLYLLFMIPIWDVFTERMHQPFQVLSATLGTSLLHLVNIPAFRTETFVYLPNVTLEVAEVCSGVNYLIAIAAVAVPHVYMSKAALSRRLLVVSIAVGVAILGNGLRVALIGWTLHLGISKDIHGPGHIFHGMFVAILGYAALFTAARLLGTDGEAQTSAPLERASLSQSSGDADASLRALACGVAMIIAALALQPTVRTAPISPGRDVTAIPFQIGDWKAMSSRLESSALRAARPDQEIVRTFAAADIGTAHLYVGYYATQGQGRELIGYRSSSAQVKGVPVSMDVGAIGHDAVAETQTDARGSQRLVVSWYDLNGRVTTNAYHAKLLTIWDGLVRGRTNGALVAITLEPPPGSPGPVSTDRAVAFVRELLPAIKRYLATDR